LKQDSVFESESAHHGEEENVLLSKHLSAIQVVQGDSDGHKLGGLTQLSAGTMLECCGDGFNERTVKVRVNGHYYIVFRQDLDLETTRHGAHFA
jgi:hypothetical protein